MADQRREARVQRFGSQEPTVADYRPRVDYTRADDRIKVDRYSHNRYSDRSNDTRRGYDDRRDYGDRQRDNDDRRRDNDDRRRDDDSGRRDNDGGRRYYDDRRRDQLFVAPPPPQPRGGGYRRDAGGYRARSPPGRYQTSRYTPQHASKSTSARNYKSTSTSDLRGSKKPTRFAGVSDDLHAKLAKAVATEWHHIDAIELNADDEVTSIVWGAAYVNPVERRRAPGGTAVLHHKCRRCKRVSLNLLGVPRTSDRYCLACDGHKDVPSWFFEN